MSAGVLALSGPLIYLKSRDPQMFTVAMMLSWHLPTRLEAASPGGLFLITFQDGAPGFQQRSPLQKPFPIRNDRTPPVKILLEAGSRGEDELAASFSVLGGGAVPAGG